MWFHLQLLDCSQDDAVLKNTNYKHTFLYTHTFIKKIKVVFYELKR